MSAVDSFVGRRIRQFRWTCGITQADIAEHLGVGRQQIEAFERGATRITAVQLFQLAEKMDVPVTAFFEGMGVSPETAPAGPRKALSTRESQMLAHFKLMPYRQQEVILSMAKAMAEHLCQASKSLDDTAVLWPEEAREG